LGRSELRSCVFSYKNYDLIVIQMTFQPKSCLILKYEAKIRQSGY